MEINDLISSDVVVANLKATSKKQVLHNLARRASKQTGVNERDIFDVLMERERLGSTGVGNGIAIPHGKFPTLKRLHGLFALLEKPVDFQAIDEHPVDLIFLLLAPESAGADHLKALAKISRVLKNRGICDKLRGSETSDALYAILTANMENQAA